MEYVIYTDESDKKGDFFSDFYGGVLVRSSDLDSVIRRLEETKEVLNLHKEVKWNKVSAAYLEKYVTLMDVFFDFIEHDIAKVRIMFTQNRNVAVGLTREQRSESYHILYYQFLKHAFGLYHATSGDPVRIRINMDQLPREKERNAKFKAFIEGLNKNPQMRRAGVRFHRDQIAEVKSHDHVLLQCLDVVLGAMCFRLNDKHLVKQEGSNRRGKRTLAKHKLYVYIRERICRLHPNFNIGITTGSHGDWSNTWNHSYRHWRFVPHEHTIDSSKSKR